MGSHTSAFRWHLADPIVFSKKIKVTIEHYGWISPDENKERRAHSWNKREDDYASVAYWYQTGIPTFGPETPPVEERILPNLDEIFMSKKVVDNKSYRHGTAEVQDNLNHYMNGQLTFTPNDPRAQVEIRFEVTEKRPVRLLLAVTKAPD